MSMNNGGKKEKKTWDFDLQTEEKLYIYKHINFCSVSKS